MDLKDTPYFEQAVLLIDILPLVSREACFALKGGTAINYFVQDMPRLSVDADLTYLPLCGREEALEAISEGLLSIARRIEKAFANTTVTPIRIESGLVTRLDVRREAATVKIEPNTVIRGTVFECQEASLCSQAAQMFERTVDACILSKADLYGGKICAALDRQHPRDLFDVVLLLKGGGFNDKVRRAFVVYLISHSRPIVEILNPGLQDVKTLFDQEFIGMTSTPVALEELISARSELITLVRNSLTTNEKTFLLSLKSGTPDWALFDVPHAQDLPAVQWKLQNIRRMDRKKREAALTKLMKYLDA